MKRMMLFLLKFSVTAGVLAYIFTHVPISQVMAVVYMVQFRFLAFAFVLIFMVMYIAAYEMSILTRGQNMNLSLHQIFRINLATRFYGLFLPGTLAGGVIRWYKLSGTDKKSVEAFLSILANRFLDTVAVLTVGFSFWVQVSHWGFYTYAGFLFLAMVYAGIFLCMNFNIKTWFLRWAGRMNGHVPSGFLRNKGSKLLMSLKSVAFSPGKTMLLLSLAFFRNVISCSAFYCFVLSLGINLNFSHAAWVASLSLIIGMLPISFFGLGLREGAFIVLLKPYGVPAEAALALSFLVIFKVIVIGLFGGFLEGISYFYHESLKLKKTGL